MSFLEAALSNEEDLLWRRFRDTKDQIARNTLVELYLPFAKQLASNLFARRPDNDVEFADYMQYACVGLIQAVDRYDTSKGAMFKTFAGYRIKGAILNGVSSETERRNQYAALNQNAKDRIDSISSCNGELNNNEIFMEMVEVTIGLALGYMLDDLGTEAPSLSVQVNDPYKGHTYRETCAHIEKAVTILDEREKRIIQYHYYHQMSFESLSDLYGVSKGRISQIHKQALRKIRSWLQSNEPVDRIY